MTHPFQEDITPDVTTGHDVVHEELAKWWNTGITQYNVESYPEATFDQRFASALADANASGGRIIIPPGEYTSSGLGTVTSQRVSIEGPGGALATRIRRVGGSTLLTFAPNPLGVGQMGTLRGIEFVGDATAGLCAVRCVDCGVLPAFDDVVIRDFTGADSVGLELANDTIWNERASGTRLALDNNTIGMRLKGGGTPGSSSFGYHRWLDLRLNVNENQVGIQSTENAYVYSGLWVVLCNIGGNNAKVIQTLDTSYWNGAYLIVTGEVTGSFTGCLGIHNGSGSFFNATGFFGIGGAGNQNDRAGDVAFNLTPPSLRVGPQTPLNMDSGSIANFLAGNAAKITPWTGSPYPGGEISAFGHLSGTNIESAFVSIYDVQGNAFVVYKVPFQAPLSAATEVFRVDANGTVSTTGPVVLKGYTTALRPPASAVARGSSIYNTDTSKPNYSDGTNWRDAMGNIV